MLDHEHRFAIQYLEGSKWRTVKVDRVTTREIALQGLDACFKGPGEARVVEVSKYPIEVTEVVGNVEYRDYELTAYQVLKVKVI
jgi:hypothetical protein